MRVESVVNEKAAVNLRIRTSLKDKAKRFGLNLSQTLEKTLESEIRRREQETWLEENREAIKAYNKRIEMYGPALSKYRSF